MRLYCMLFKKRFFTLSFGVFFSNYAAYMNLLNTRGISLALPEYMQDHLFPSVYKHYSYQPTLEKYARKVVSDTMNEAYLVKRSDNLLLHGALNLKSIRFFKNYIDEHVQESLKALSIDPNNIYFNDLLQKDLMPYLKDRDAVKPFISKVFSDGQKDSLKSVFYYLLTNVSGFERIPNIAQITAQGTDPYKMSGATGPSVVDEERSYDIFISPSLGNDRHMTAVLVHELGHLLHAHPHWLLAIKKYWIRQHPWKMTLLWGDFNLRYSALSRAYEFQADATVLCNLKNESSEEILYLAGCMVEMFLTKFICEKLEYEQRHGNNSYLSGLFEPSPSINKEDHPSWVSRLVFLIKLYDLIHDNVANKNTSDNKIRTFSVTDFPKGENIFKETDLKVEWQEKISKSLKTIENHFAKEFSDEEFPDKDLLHEFIHFAVRNMLNVSEDDQDLQSFEGWLTEINKKYYSIDSKTNNKILRAYDLIEELFGQNLRSAPGDKKKKKDLYIELADLYKTALLDILTKN